MRVVHFALMSPNMAGLYGTTKDLIAGERECGIQADIVDFGFENKAEERMLEDGWLKTVHWQTALDADLVVRHSAAPKEVCEKVPFLVALHGRPINTFLLSFNNGRENPIIETLYQVAEHKMFRGFVSFWQQNTQVWSKLFPRSKIYSIPAPVDLVRFTPSGPAHKFDGEADFNILIADMWREDSCPVTPFYDALNAAAEVKAKTGVLVKVSIAGLPKRAKELLNLIKSKSGNEHIGQLFPMVANIELLYRSADMILTSHMIATRIVREAFACGTPVLTGALSPDYMPTIKSSVPLQDAILELIRRGRGKLRRECRSYAEACFDYKKAGLAMKNAFEQVLG